MSIEKIENTTESHQKTNDSSTKSQDQDFLTYYKDVYLGL